MIWMESVCCSILINLNSCQRMHLILLFLLQFSINYGNAAENSNKEQIVYKSFETKKGIPLLRIKRSNDDIPGETVQDPKDPTYHKMAEEIAYQHLHYKKEDVQKIEVNEVKTQISELKTRKQFEVALSNGKAISCSSEVLEQFYIQAKHVSYKCQEIEDITFPYFQIAKKAAEDHINNLQEAHNIVNMTITPLPVVELPVGKTKVLYFNIESTCKHYGGVDSVQRCTVVFDLVTGDTVPISVDCFEDPNEHFKGADVWMNPADAKYIELARNSILHDPKVINDAKDYDIIVTFVIHKVSWGRNKMDFIVRVPNGEEFKCLANVWEKTSEVFVQNVKCKLYDKNAKN